MLKKSLMIVSSLVLALSFLSACGNGAESGSAPTDNASNVDKVQKHDPVTLTFGPNQGGYNEQAFNEFVKKPVEAKFPYITLNYVATTNGSDIEKLIAAGEAPDILNGGGRGMVKLVDLGLAEELTPYIKKFNLNLGDYNPAGIASIKDYSGGGKMQALPYTINFYVMLYNKDIFDKFGVGYPQDNMTWDDVKKLAERVTRQADGVQYKGVLPGNVSLMARGLSLSYVDPKTKMASVNNAQWKNLFELALSMYNIPGNMPKNQKQLFNVDEFYKDKVLAMLPAYSVQITSIAGKENPGFNWDMTSYPSFEPGKSNEVDTQVMLMSTTSKHKDDAFQVIQFLTTSKEIQSELAKSGQQPALKLDNFQDIYGSNYPILKQKNVKGVFKVETRTPHPFNEYDDIVRKQVDNIFIDEYLKGGIDANTALRQIEEQANKAIKEDMSK
ncbi:MAG: family 1 extracellular solute-binding protein [Paenibacillaceae bacterium]|nr:family 1 extracellular solute-binding protein [Paenibacillaceae bacterium]